MRLAIAVPEAHVKPDVLNAGLEATTRLNEEMIQSREVPLFRDAVNKVRWKPEPPGDECFDHAKVVLGRGWGDCDDLAPWHAASLRSTGEDEGAQAIVKKSGPKRWHAVVLRSDGSIDDPSREAGMGQTNGVMGAKLPPMLAGIAGESSVSGTYLMRPQLAFRPVRERNGQIEAWQARADLPWHWAPGRSPADVAMVTLHASPVSSQSIVGACNGLLRLGEANDVDDEVLLRAAAIRDMCEGATWEDCADEYGEDEATAAGHLVHGFFSVGSGQVRPYTPPINRFPGDAAHLGQVFWRYARGEQPRERGGKHYTLKELQYATQNENAYRATLTPEALAQRKAMFAGEGHAAHEKRRQARQFTNVVRSGLTDALAMPLNVASHIPGVSNVLQAASPLLSAALPLAQRLLPFIPGMGTLSSAALQMASPMLQDVLSQGLHLPPPQAMQQPSAPAFSFGGSPLPGMAAFFG